MGAKNAKKPFRGGLGLGAIFKKTDPKPGPQEKRGKGKEKGGKTNGFGRRMYFQGRGGGASEKRGAHFFFFPKGPLGKLIFPTPPQFPRGPGVFCFARHFFFSGAAPL